MHHGYNYINYIAVSSSLLLTSGTTSSSADTLNRSNNSEAILWYLQV